MAATARDGKPVLGVCLGAQQLAMALGAEVTTGPEPEIGLGQVELTGPGRLDPVTGPEYGGLSAVAIPCVHWHRDTFSLPEGAVHLAASPRFPHQAFRWGDRAYGLQFHVEVDRALAAGWEAHLPPGVTLSGSGVAQVETVGRRLLRRFVQRALSPPSPGWSPTRRRCGRRPRGSGALSTDTVAQASRPEGADGDGPAVKPRLRGVLHEVAFFVSLVSGTALVWAAPTEGSKLAMAVYAVAISLLFGVSALFHRHTWGPVGRRRMRRADHSTIFVAIAGSYTAVAGIALTGWARSTVLCIVWAGAPSASPFARRGWTRRSGWSPCPTWWWGGPPSPCCPSCTGPSVGPGSRYCWPVGWPTRPAPWCTPGRGPTRPRGLRVPRGVPRLHHRGSGPALRGHRVVRAAPGRLRFPTVSRPSGAACTAGSRRCGSTRPPSGCRCAPGPELDAPGDVPGADDDRLRDGRVVERVEAGDQNTSCPVSPREAACWPSANCSGSTPMPIRFERWMRS